MSRNFQNETVDTIGRTYCAKSCKTRTYDQLTTAGLRFLCRERNIRVPRHTRDEYLRQLHIQDNNQGNTGRPEIEIRFLTMAALIEDCDDFGIASNGQGRATLIQLLSDRLREVKRELESGVIHGPNVRRHFRP